MGGRVGDRDGRDVSRAVSRVRAFVRANSRWLFNLSRREAPARADLCSPEPRAESREPEVEFDDRAYLPFPPPFFRRSWKRKPVCVIAAKELGGDVL